MGEIGRSGIGHPTAKTWAMRAAALAMVVLALIRGGGAREDAIQAWVARIEAQRLVRALARPTGQLLIDAGLTDEDVVGMLRSTPSLAEKREQPPEGSQVTVDYTETGVSRAVLDWQGEGRWVWIRSFEQATWEARFEPVGRRLE